MTYDANNIFARIMRAEIPCTKIYEDDAVFAFNDIAPVAPVHVLVMPKGPYTSFNDFASNASQEEVGYFFATVRKIAVQCGLEKKGYRLITNHGADASQSVPHFHVHIVGGTQMGAIL